MKNKICPIMAQGWIAGRLANGNYPSLNYKETIEKLPLCLKENCALWIAESFAGSLHGDEHCGLKK